MNTRAVGDKYEDLAVRYLAEHGCRVTVRNFRCKFGEVDIVALDGDELVFVEVKYRKSKSAGSPFEAVGWQKQKKISAVCNYYLMTHPRDAARQVRFDVIGIFGDTVEWVKNAFGYVGI